MSDLQILVGTTKGVFILGSDGDRADWSLSGPHCDLWTINHVKADPETGTLWAGGGGEWTGAGIWRSDGGADWTLTRLSKGLQDEWAANAPDFAEMIGWTDTPLPFDGLDAVWSVDVAHGVVRIGTRPAKLFESRDTGQSWQPVDGFNGFPGRNEWNPGAAGLILHTIVPAPEDADKLWLGVSAAGVFATEDGGATWDRRNRLSNAAACEGHDHPAAPADGETGHCVHNIARPGGASGDLLYQQNHHGVWRSTDGGRHWDEAGAGLPSTFGFPIAVHPHDAQTIWTVPLNGDSAGRYPPDASAAVWKSEDAGESWRACRDGLPGENCFFTVLRQAMATDRQEEAGVYFGTNTGSIFASRDAGESWDEIARHLPTVLSVEVLDRV